MVIKGRGREFSASAPKTKVSAEFFLEAFEVLQFLLEL